MNELEIQRQRARLLASARVLLNEEYQKQRSAQFTKWQTESNHLWVSKGIMLPYPSSFEYPTEEQVVAKALELYNSQTNNKPASVLPALPAIDESFTSSVTAKLMEVSNNVQPSLPEETLITEEIKQSVPEAKVIEPSVEVAIPEPVLEQESEIQDVVANDDPILTEEQQIEEAKSNSRLRSLLAQFITMAKVLDAKAQKDEGTPI